MIEIDVYERVFRYCERSRFVCVCNRTCMFLCVCLMSRDETNMLLPRIPHISALIVVRMPTSVMSLKTYVVPRRFVIARFVLNKSSSVSAIVGKNL